MTDHVSHPYDTHLDIRYGPLELVDVQALVDASTHPWYNQTLCKVNDSVVRLGVVEGEYHWHQHDAEDEFFYVVAGRFIVDLEGRSVELAPRQGLDRKSTRLNSSHLVISYAVFCLKKKKNTAR